jgi:RNA-directed DNA polymerase
LWQQTMGVRGGWVVEVDIRKFFDNLDHARLRELVQRRVRDGVLLRLIGKWLNAGVLERGVLSYPEAGSPQGGVISPILSNIYLHYVLDVWFEEEVKPRLRGQAFLIRYADDFVMGFACEEDARRVLEVLPKRFGKYGLTIHPDKTRLVPFVGRPSRSLPSATGTVSPETFDFLGFTHYWGLTRKGNWAVKRRTARGRFQRAARKVAEWCRANRHQPIPEQHVTLSRKLSGHYGYYGITGNFPALARFHRVVVRLWQRGLSRRSWAGRLTWDQFNRLGQRFPLPTPVLVHSVFRPAANR